MIWFEDVRIGSRTELGSWTFTEDEIVRFAREFDPQPFHTDPEAAKASVYGGLIASGWHVAAIWMKLMVASRTAQRAAAGRDGAPPGAGVSPGFLDMRWHGPTRPGMTLRYSSTVSEKVELKSRPNLGLVRMRNEAVDADGGGLIFSFTGQGFWPRRPA